MGEQYKMQNAQTDATFAALQRRLNHTFVDCQLLRDALTHPSLHSNQRRKKPSAVNEPSKYERLEFLGDRVLGLAVADMLLRQFPDEPEGDLALRFTSQVNQVPLAEVSIELGLDAAIILSDGTIKENGRANASILSDTCEAVIGAIYLDAGFEVAKQFVERLWCERILKDPAPPVDAKTALQEWAQGRGLPLPKYTVLSQEGPAHAPTFEMQVEVLNSGSESAKGGSKRIAEQTAAVALLSRLSGKGKDT